MTTIKSHGGWTHPGLHNPQLSHELPRLALKLAPVKASPEDSVEVRDK